MIRVYFDLLGAGFICHDLFPRLSCQLEENAKFRRRYCKFEQFSVVKKRQSAAVGLLATDDIEFHNVGA